MFVAILALVSAGLLIAIQASMNAALSRNLGLLLFTFTFSALQLLASVPGVFFSGRPLALSSFASAPAWQYIGAVLGVVILCAMAYGLTRVSSFTGFMAILSGQLAGALIIDRFGLFGYAAQPVGWSRLAGLFLVFAGVWLSRPR